MEIVKAFNSNELHTEILIKGTQLEPLFRASDIGEILEMGNIRTSINDFNDTEKVGVHTMDTTGRQQLITFLTEKGLYKVLFKSRKPIAEKFQNWVCDVIKEIRLTGKYTLEKQLEDAKNEIIHIEETNKKELDIKVKKEREQILLREFKTIGSMIYIIKVKTYSDGTYIVKIGESRKGVQDRYNECKSKHTDVLLLDCFAVKNCLGFESFIHNHEQIRGSNVKLLPEHEKESELFLIGKNLSYKTLLQIINTNIKHFDYQLEKLQEENETLKQIIASFPSEHQQFQFEKSEILDTLLNGQKEMIKMIRNLETANKDIVSKLNSMQTKTTTNFNQPLVTLGPRLQKINPETMNIIKVYESVAECLKEYNFKVKRPSIDKAVKENTVYNGFRWAFVDRNLDANIIHNLPPTKQTKTQNLGYIAKLNKEKKQILNVYLDRKSAASFNGYTSSSALDTPVKNMSLTNGHYYTLYDNCPEETILNFEQQHGEPVLYKDGIGQYTADNQLIKEFVCKYDCIKQLKMSDKTLAKALDADVLYNNSYFKRIGSKLKVL
jgi:prophage antirepressor-like protein